MLVRWRASQREVDHTRLSFCCDQCRRRLTPRSVFYLGRRVYVGAMVLLASALRGGVSGAGRAQSCATLRVPWATLDRWRDWWNEVFPTTALWQSLRGRFVAPITGLLPAGLLARFSAADAATRALQALVLIAPLSTHSEVR